VRISVVTIFPEMFEALTCCGVFKRAKEEGLIQFDAYNLRNFTTDRHRTTDAYPFGGGPGMVMRPEPFFRFVDWYTERFGKPYVILTTPQGEVFHNELAMELSKKENLVILCGRYEGVDERVTTIVDKEISIGDYVLSGGELAAMVIAEAVSRFVPGVMGDEESLKDSFYNGLLDHPSYTRPAVYKGMAVPEVLRSGDHERIEMYRKMESMKRTILRRPDLFMKKELTEEDKRVIVELVRSLVGGESRD